MNTALDLVKHYFSIMLIEGKKQLSEFALVLLYLFIGNAYGMGAVALGFRIQHIPEDFTGFVFQSLTLAAVVMFLGYLLLKGLFGVITQAIKK